MVLLLFVFVTLLARLKSYYVVKNKRIKNCLNQSHLTEIERATLKSKLKKYLMESTEIIGDETNQSDIIWLSFNLWDLAYVLFSFRAYVTVFVCLLERLQNGTADLFDATHELLDRLDLSENPKYNNTKKLCCLFSAVSRICQISTINECSKNTAKQILASIATIKDNEEQHEDDEGISMKQYFDIISLIQLKCYLVLGDETRIKELLQANTANVIEDIVRFETMLSILVRFDSLHHVITIIDHIIKCINIKEKHQNNNVTMDVLKDYVRYNRLLITYKMKMSNNNQQTSEYFKYFEDVTKQMFVCCNVYIANEFEIFNLIWPFISGSFAI